jgi:replicative DNA helicase
VSDGYKFGATSISNASIHERSILGAILIDSSCWAETEGLTADDFRSEFCRKVYRAMNQLREEGHVIDSASVAATAGVEISEVEALDEGVLPDAIHTHIEKLHEAKLRHQLELLHEALGHSLEMAGFDHADVERQLLEMSECLKNGHHGANRRISSFEAVSNIMSVEIPTMEFIIPAIGIARNTITSGAGLTAMLRPCSPKRCR